MRLICLILSFFLIGFSNAQLLEELKSRLKNTAVTKASDFNSSRSNKQKGLTKSNLTGEGNTEGEKHPEGSPTPATPEKGYDIQIKASYHIQNLSTGENTQFDYFVGEHSFFKYTDDGKDIYDASKQELIAADEFVKEMKVSPLDPILGATENAEASQVMKATGNTQTIGGFVCREFELLEKGHKLWISETVNLNGGVLQRLREVEAMNLGLSYSALSGLNGLVMKITLSEGDQYEFGVDQLTPHQEKVDLTGYQVRP
ncbi:MAG: hypothetical protein EP338_00060 [Bacteroidetes bacterium]|nr:MAG: hypothetical protein EP338_00060 [Bacteroidota bacterium]